MANDNCISTSLVEELVVTGGSHPGIYSLANSKLRLDGENTGYEITVSDLKVVGVTYTIKIRDVETSIDNFAFILCNNLALVTFGPSLESIGNSAFLGCKKLESVTIPNSVTSIGSSAFKSCEGLESVIIGNSVTSIGEQSFRDCIKLRSVIIPDSVTSIYADAFKECESLESVTIGNSVIDIGFRVFQTCSNLNEIIFNFPDPGESQHIQINNVSKLPLINGNGNAITYGDSYIFYGVPTQEAIYITPGCTNAEASNYNPDATQDDGSCIITGCTNAEASNYNPDATQDDESCIITGCTDQSAENYNSNATQDDGSCFIVGYENGVLRLGVR
jgi:hypothetical protein